MTERDRFSERDLDVLLRQAQVIRPVPDVVRARALARARATVATAAAAAATGAPRDTAPAPARGRGIRIAFAAGVALLLGAAGAVAALGIRAVDREAPAPSSKPQAVTPVRVARHEGPASPASPQTRLVAKPAHAARPATAQESYAAELGLLHRAQIAYTSGDFVGALVLVAEHTRQFPHGRLTEEREALRVRSLAGAGRKDDARRATAAFARRFPRSALLPRLESAAAGLER
jgi:hypothetical protein